MTIWQFDSTTQNTIYQQIIVEIVKLPNCHDKKSQLAGIPTETEPKVGKW